ncbi:MULTISPECIES: hypothetical protein [Streptomyces]|uniref:Secreted protein n=1 Tax=Streptomyces albus (strain ATCC 21838 / DSM 41398 / FERM P-419 / JCM 4703 / NBRC 107858) TaxID=1081613 RepID=A0A0B5ES53_STRA4|nr:hypothetical protein [Streptomyces sp. SCSIO ZS0520]AJE85643.1 hypothetical protein SLNWT_5267 [Streptomyces albus]AOU79945.1 hypothetical protein SLNHY_5254 [Streptomyces albus]AYN35662.1 hypothetical protein DUI70_5166 [Streptomyces albus]
MKKKSIAIVASLAALAAIPLTAGPAAAYEAASSCDLQFGGAVSPFNGRAVGSWDWSTKTKLTSLHMEARDYEADGWHPAVRLVTKKSNGDTHAWQWHHNTAGADTTRSWNTTASDTGGIRKAWIQGALFDGSKLVGYCNGGVRPNPIY